MAKRPTQKELLDPLASAERRIQRDRRLIANLRLEREILHEEIGKLKAQNDEIQARSAAELAAADQRYSGRLKEAETAALDHKRRREAAEGELTQFGKILSAVAAALEPQLLAITGQGHIDEWSSDRDRHNVPRRDLLPMAARLLQWRCGFLSDEVEKADEVISDLRRAFDTGHRLVEVKAINAARDYDNPERKATSRTRGQG